MNVNLTGKQYLSLLTIYCALILLTHGNEAQEMISRKYLVIHAGISIGIKDRHVLQNLAEVRGHELARLRNADQIKGMLKNFPDLSR